MASGKQRHQIFSYAPPLTPPLPQQPPSSSSSPLPLAILPCYFQYLASFSLLCCAMVCLDAVTAAIMVISLHHYHCFQHFKTERGAAEGENNLTQNLQRSNENKG